MADRKIKYIIESIKKGKGLEEIQKGLKKVSSESKKTTKTAKSGFGQMKSSWIDFAKGFLAYNVFATAMGAVKSFVTGSIEAFGKQEKAVARLTAALKNQNQYTDENIQLLKDQAKALQRVTTFGDEEIISAQAMLTSFALTTDQIKDMTPRMLDLATMTAKTTGGQMDLEQAAKFVGMALGGQAGRLTQAGIRLDEFQKKEFQAANETERFNMLIKIFDQNAKGLAESVGKTAAGQMERFQNEIGDLQEELGAVLLPILVDDLIPAFREMVPVIKEIIVNVKYFFIGVKAAAKGTKDFYEAIKGLKNWLLILNPALWTTITALEKIVELFVVMAETEKVVNEANKSTSKSLSEIDYQMAKLASIGKKTKKTKEEGIKTTKTSTEKLKEEAAAEIEAAMAKVKAGQIKKGKKDEKGNIKEQKTEVESLEETYRKSFASMTDSQGNFAKATESAGNTIIEQIKKPLYAQLEAWAATETAKLLAAAPATFGGSLAGIPAVIAAVAGGKAALDAIQLAEGGIVTKPTMAVMGERNKKEAVIPLESDKAKKELGGLGGGVTVNINAGAMMGKSNDAYQFAKIVQRQVKRINRRDITV